MQAAQLNGTIFTKKLVNTKSKVQQDHLSNFMENVQKKNECKQRKKNFLPWKHHIYNISSIDSKMNFYIDINTIWVVLQ